MFRVTCRRDIDVISHLICLDNPIGRQSASDLLAAVEIPLGRSAAIALYSAPLIRLRLSGREYVTLAPRATRAIVRDSESKRGRRQDDDRCQLSAALAAAGTSGLRDRSSIPRRMPRCTWA